MKFIKHDYEQVVPHIYTLQIPEHLNLDYIREVLLKKGIQTGLHYQPNHILSLYSNGLEIKVTEKLSKSLLSIPLHPDLNKKDIQYVCKCLNALT